MNEKFLLIWQIFSAGVYAQNPVLTRQDTLRGSITPELAWWDFVRGIKQYKRLTRLSKNPIIRKFHKDLSL